MCVWLFLEDAFVDFPLCSDKSSCRLFYLQVSYGFKDEVYDFAAYFVHFWISGIQICGHFVIDPYHGYIFRLVFISLRMGWYIYIYIYIYMYRLYFPLISSSHPFFSGNSLRHSNNRFLLLFVQLGFFT